MPTERNRPWVALALDAPQEQPAIRSALQQAGFQVAECANAQDIEHLTEQAACLVIVDAAHGQFDALNLARRLCQVPRSRNLGVLLLLPGGPAAPGWGEEFLDRPVGFFARPIRPEELASFARRFVGRVQSQSAQGDQAWRDE